MGPRPNEALALKWSDWTDNKLRIQRSLTRITGQSISFKTTKTGRGRVVTLSPSVVVALKEHRKRQAEERLASGAEHDDLGLMFATPTGSPMDLTNFSKRNFKPLLKEAKLPDIRFYDLRHTAATNRLVNGDNPKVVSEMLGHASIVLTMDTYSHVIPTMQEDSAERLEAMLFG